MDHKDFKRKPARLRSALAGVALATASGWAAALADSPAQFEIDMVCPFPLVGDTPIKAKGTATIPSATQQGRAVQGINVNIEAVVPPLVSKSLNLLNAPATEITESDQLVTIVDQFDPESTFETNGLVALSSNPLNKLNGTASAAVSVYQANGAVLPISLTVALDEGTVPQDGTETVLTGTGAVTDRLIFRAPGALDILLEGISLTVGTSYEDGTTGPAPLDSFSATCEFEPIQIATAAVCTGAEGTGPVFCDLDVVHPRDANFGFVANGGTQTISLPISNAANITTASIEGADAGDFSQSSTCTGADTCTVDVTFSPSSLGKKDALLVLNTGVWIPLKGESVDAVEPIISVSSSTLDYGTVENGRAPVKTLTITNTGYADAASVLPQISGDTDNFRLKDTNCFDLPIGKSCDIDVEYRVLFEQGEASHSGSLAVDAGSASVSVPLSGATGAVSGPRYDTALDLDMACFFPLIEEAAIRVSGSVGLPEAGVTGEPLAQISLEISAQTEENVMQGGEIVSLNYLAGAADALLDLIIPGVGTVPLTVPVDLELGVVPFDETFAGNYIPTTLYGSTTIPVNLVFDNPGDVEIVLNGITLRARGFQAALDLNTFLPILDGETLNPMDPSNRDQQFHLLLDDCNSTKTPAEGVFVGETFEFSPFTVGSIKICTPETAESECGIVVGPSEPEIDVAPTSLSLGSVTVGESATQSFTVSNSGEADLTLSVLTSGTGFSDDGGCPGVVAPGASCTVAVTFAPTAGGDASGSVTINSNDADEASVTVALAGTGVEATLPPAIEIVAAVDFGSAIVGESATQVISVGNSGGEDLVVQDGTVTGPFVLDGFSCTTVAPGATCEWTLTYTATAAGAETGVFTIISNDPNSPTEVALTGSGTATAPEIDVATAPLDLGTANVGESTTADLTISNVGDADLVISGLTASGDFSVASDCGTVAPAASCTATVTFTPSADGAASGTLSIASNDEDEASIDIALSGAGVVLVADVDVSPTEVAFGDVTVGGSATSEITIANTGNADLSIVSIAVASPVFSVTDTCGGTVAAGGSCAATVTFAPNAAGAADAVLAVTSDDADEPVVSVALSGNGVDVPVVDIAVSPATLAFGNVQVGESATADVTITSEGNATLEVSEVAISGTDLSVDASCGSLNQGESCTATVTFAPTAEGPVTGTLTVSSNDPDEGTVVIDITGAGVTAPEADINLPVTSVDFGELTVGQDSSEDFSIENVGTADLTISDISVDGGDFTVVSDCGVVAAGESCTATVTFAPGAAGDQSATVTVSSDDADEPTVTVAVSGSATEASVEADIDVNPTSVEFGSVLVGTSTDPFDVTVSNVGGEDLVVIQSQITGDGAGAFSIVESTCSTVAGGSSCTISVNFTPTDTVAYEAALGIVSSDADEPAVAVFLTGAGMEDVVLPANIVASTDAVDFGEVAGETTAEVTFTNTGEEDFTATDISATGAFSVSSDCSFVAAGDSCTAVVTFSPTVEGQAETGTLTVAGEGTSATVNLSGSLEDTTVGETYSIKALFDGTVKFANGLRTKLRGLLQAEVAEDGSLTGQVGFSKTTVNAIYGGLPLVALMKVEQAEGTEVTGSTDGTNLTVNTQVNVKFSSIYLRLFGFFKIPLGGGPNCSTVTPSDVTLSGVAGGEVAGTFEMSQFTNCGFFTSTLNDALADGTNEVKLDTSVAIVEDSDGSEGRKRDRR